MKVLKRLLLWRDISVVVVFSGMIAIFAIFTPNNVFLNPGNFNSIGQIMPELGIISLGIGILMISGEFDLSVTSQIPLCSYVIVVLLKAGLGLGVILPVVFLLGLALGLINGLITTKGGLPSFIVTLGTMMFWRGVVFLWSNRAPVSLYGLIPKESIIEDIFTTKVFGLVPVQMFWFVGIATILWSILHFHKFGNWIYSTGGNRRAAKAMGIDVDMVKIVSFMNVGALSAIVAIIQIFRLGSFSATQARGFALRAIAAAVVGGVSLWGGVGSMLGIFLGALTIQILANGLILMRVPVFGVDTFIGAAVVVFVLVNTYLERKRKQLKGG